MGTAENVQMGVCDVEFDGTDLGYTKGFVKMSYNIETVEKTVDQMDTPIDELITKQTLTVTVPMAEKNLQTFVKLFPGATLVTGAGADLGEFKLTLSGASGASAGALGKVLVIKPVGGTVHDWVTLYKAVPIPSIEASYDKDNVQIFQVVFKAIPDATSQWVMFGKEAIVIA